MLTGVRPEVIVADKHPAYRSGAWAERTQGLARAAPRAAPSRAHRLGDGRERPRRIGARHRHRLRRHGIRRRRRGVGRRGAARRLRRLRACRPSALHLVARRRCGRAQPVPDGAVAPALGGCRVGSRTALRAAPAPRTRSPSSPGSSIAGSAARRPRAWAACSTRCPHSPASATASPTRPRPRCASRAWPARAVDDCDASVRVRDRRARRRAVAARPVAGGARRRPRRRRRRSRGGRRGALPPRRRRPRLADRACGCARCTRSARSRCRAGCS